MDRLIVAVLRFFQNCFWCQRKKYKFPGKSVVIGLSKTFAPKLYVAIKKFLEIQYIILLLLLLNTILIDLNNQDDDVIDL